MAVLVPGGRTSIGSISGMSVASAQFNTGPNKGRSGSITSFAGSSNLHIQSWVTDKDGNEVPHSRVGASGGATSPQILFNGKSDLCQLDTNAIYTVNVSQVEPPQDGGPFGIDCDYNQPRPPK